MAIDDDRKEELTISIENSQFVWREPLEYLDSLIDPLKVDVSKAQQSMLRDIDASLARIENGIAAEQAAIDALLNRLAKASG